MAEVTKVEIKDYSPEVLKAMKEDVQLALQAIGMEAVGYAQAECPVDTGRLRNSIAYSTATGSGGGDSSPNGTAEENAVYVGSNVEYAPYVELMDRAHKVGRAHFLRDAMTTHGEHYKEILKSFLE